MKLRYPALLALFCAPLAQAADLYISEYIEGSSNNKAIELYNPGSQPVDLSTYQLAFYFNGGVTPSSTISLTGTLAAGGTFVVADDSADSSLLAKANQLSTVSFFNGDDAIVLTHGSSIVDSIGQVGNDPGSYWGTSDLSTQNYTLIRKTTVSQGDSNPGDSFDPSVEWNVFPVDTFSHLGSYDGSSSTGGGSGSGGDTGGSTGSGTGEVISNACYNCPDLDKINDATTFNDSQYYKTVEDDIAANDDVATIREALSKTIHQTRVLTYSQVWTALTQTDQDPANPNNVILLYKGTSISKFSNGSGAQSSDPNNWNREHVWAKSHGFPDQSNEAYTDINHLRPADISINSLRSNLDFDLSGEPVTEAPDNKIDSDSFEPRDAVKGDVARMLMYMDIRYEGKDGDITPNLILVNSLTDGSSPEIGRLCRMLQWNAADPVDDFERTRNNRIYELQGNRNPFIDHPEWVSLFFQAASCPDIGSNTGGNTGGSGNNGTGGGTGSGGDTGTGGATGGSTGSSALVFINEFHYDNVGTDGNEGIEVAAPAGTDLTGYSLVMYNGKGGKQYKSVALTGVVADQQGGFGTVSVAVSGLQNGAPDGFALVDPDGQVLQFLSYEGQFAAADGPAAGMTSVDVGQVEGSGTPADFSIQLAGSGFQASDFVWQAPSVSSFGSPNSAQTFVAPTPFVNEIHYDNGGSDTGEGIEIAGPAGLDLSGYSIVLYNGKGGASYKTVSLSGAVPNQQNGFGTRWFDIGGIQNGSPDGLALVDGNGQVLQFLSYEGEFTAVGGPADGMASTNIGVSEPSSTATGDTLQLKGSGYSYTDFSWEGPLTGTPGDVNTDQTFGVAGNGSQAADIGVCGDPATLISEVQGNSDVSPLVGKKRVIEGVVTGAFDSLYGFYVQEEAKDDDGDPATSEGVFVYQPNGTLPSTGQVVRVLGDISEYNGKTEMVEDQLLSGCGSATITPVVLHLPFASLSRAEALEGMLVSADQNLTVSDNYSLGSHGEVTLSSHRLFVPTNLYRPGSPEALALADENARNKVVLDDLISGSHPDPVIYPTGGLSADNTLRVGDTVTNVMGIFDYAYNVYRVYPTTAPNFIHSNPRPAAPDVAPGNVTVASANVLNLFNGDGQGGGFPTARGADTAQEFERQITKTVDAFSIMNADVVGLMELENDGFNNASTIAELVRRLNDKMGANTYRFINAGGQVGTDAITVGLIYKPAKVQPLGAVMVNHNAIFNRPPLAQVFKLKKSGKQFVVIANHLKSKGSCPSSGDNKDQGDSQGCWNAKRVEQAQTLMDWIHNEPRIANHENVLLIGDMNANAMEDPIKVMTDTGYTNLIKQFDGADAYSYMFQGQVGYLDHALASPALAAQVVDAKEWHINADEPAVLDYNMEGKSAAQQALFYNPDEYRISDHDPLIVSFNLVGEGAASALPGDWDKDGDVDIDDIRAFFMAYRTHQTIDMSFDFNGDGVVDLRDYGLLRSLCTRARCGTK